MAGFVNPTRTEALDRMTRALEAAKRARDRGVNVRGERILLKEARSAFEHGDYATATARADSILAHLGMSSAEMPSVTAPPPAGPATGVIGVDAAGRLAEAAETVKRAKASGFNVEVAKAALKQAKKAFKAKDYATTVQLANQAIQLSGSTGRVRV